MNNIEYLKFLNNIAYVHSNYWQYVLFFKKWKIKEFWCFANNFIVYAFHFYDNLSYVEKPDIFELFSEKDIFYLIVFLNFVPLMLMVRKLLIVLFKKYLTKNKIMIWYTHKAF